MLPGGCNAVWVSVDGEQRAIWRRQQTTNKHLIANGQNASGHRYKQTNIRRVERQDQEVRLKQTTQTSDGGKKRSTKERALLRLRLHFATFHRGSEQVHSQATRQSQVESTSTDRSDDKSDFFMKVAHPAFLNIKRPCTK